MKYELAATLRLAKQRVERAAGQACDYNDLVVFDSDFRCFKNQRSYKVSF